jgi:hypothetical protein
MKRSLLTMCFAVLTVSGALAQQKKAVPPPKPADGPSLEVTMKFIQDKMNDVGPVNYVEYNHDNVAARKFITQRTSLELSNEQPPVSARCGAVIDAPKTWTRPIAPC